MRGLAFVASKASVACAAFRAFKAFKAFIMLSEIVINIFFIIPIQVIQNYYTRNKSGFAANCFQVQNTIENFEINVTGFSIFVISCLYF